MEYIEIENEALVYDCLKYGKKPISTLMKNQKIFKKSSSFCNGDLRKLAKMLNLTHLWKKYMWKKNEETSSVESFYSNVNLEEPD